MTRNHTQSIGMKYLKKCELYEKEFGNSTEFKHHMKNSNNQNLSVKFAILWESYGRTYWQNPYWIFQMWSIWEEFWWFRKVRNSFKYFWNVHCRRCNRKEITTTNIINHAEKTHRFKSNTYRSHKWGRKRGFLSSWCLITIITTDVCFCEDNHRGVESYGAILCLYIYV